MIRRPPRSTLFPSPTLFRSTPVKRGAEKLTFSITTTADTQDPKRAIVGVLPIQALSIRLPFPIKFNLRKVGGPSAGLAFALELLEKEGRDVDHGYREIGRASCRERV